MKEQFIKSVEEAVGGFLSQGQIAKLSEVLSECMQEHISRHKKRIAERKHRSHNSNTSFMKENTGPETRPPQIKTELRGLTEVFSFIMARTSFRVLSSAIICAFAQKCNCGFCHISGSMGGDFCEQCVSSRKSPPL